MTDVSQVRHPSDVDGEARASAAFDLVQKDHDLAEHEIRSIIGDPYASIRSRMIAHWGLGRLLHDAGEIAEALDIYPTAVALAASLESATDEAQIRVSWSLCLQAAGRADAALQQLKQAEPALRDAALGRLLKQRGFVLTHLGKCEAAVVEFDRALPLLHANGDRLGEARLLTNRGVAHMQLGHVAAAKRDFASSAHIADEIGHHLISAGAQHNMGWLAGRLGELPEALHLFDLARKRYVAHGSPGRLMAALDTDQCEVHLLAGLGEEAREVAGRLLEQSAASGNAMQLAESHLTMARAQLLLGDADEAASHADRAAALFRDSSRPPWEALAIYIGVTARSGSAAPVPQSGDEDAFDSLRHAAETLEDQGWLTEAAEVRVMLGRLAIGAGRLEDARRDLRRAATARYRGRPIQRSQGWHATALLRIAAGDRRGAKIAITSGLRVLDQHRATLGATELRAMSSAHGTGLAVLGLRMALDTRRASDVLVAAERWRAGSLSVTRAGKPSDPDSAADLAELRRLDGEVRAATLAGRVGQREVGIAPLRRSIDVLERRITQRARLAPGDPRRVGSRLDVAEVRSRLGDKELIEFATADGILHGVVVSADRCKLVKIGPVDSVEVTTDHLMFALRQLVLAGSSDRSAELAFERLFVAAHDVDRHLIEPLQTATSSGLVVVPLASMASVAWSLLPGIVSRGGTTIAPSAAWWLDAARPDIVTSGTVLVAGPDLDGAVDEVAALHARRPGATTLTGEQATSGAVLAAMNGADVVHIAAHGTFRGDNPMFSSLQLADGPLLVHDLETVTDPPRLVILTSCHGARSGVLPGEELIGTATALLSVGVHAVIAPVVAIPDSATVQFAIDVHDALGQGVSASDAVATAVRSALNGGSPLAVMAAGSFHCFAGSEHRVSKKIVGAL